MYYIYNVYFVGESNLCWAYSIATMIRHSLLRFFEQNRGNVDAATQQNVLNRLRSNEFHFYLRNELIMVPIPKRVQRNLQNHQRDSETHDVYAALLRVNIDSETFVEGL